VQSARSIDGATVPLRKYAGKLTIVTNSASNDNARNYTNLNFDRLNYLHSKYKGQGFQARPQHRHRSVLA